MSQFSREDDSVERLAWSFNVVYCVLGQECFPNCLKPPSTDEQ